jgi:hypothetical protein
VTERTVETVMSASERVSAAGDATEMVRHARLLGQATAHLITSIKVPPQASLTFSVLDAYRRQILFHHQPINLLTATVGYSRQVKICFTRVNNRQRYTMCWAHFHLCDIPDVALKRLM